LAALYRIPSSLLAGGMAVAMMIGIKLMTTVAEKLRTILQLAALLLLAWHPGAARAQALCQDPGATMLWQVTGTELDKRGITLNLLGSIHVGRTDFYPLAPEIENRFKSADALVFEVDPRILSSPQSAQMIQQRGMLPAGQALDEVVSAETMEALDDILRKLELPVQAVSGLRPWLVSLMLASVQVQALGYNAQFGIENYLMREMRVGTGILELETLDSQVAMLEALDQETFLRYSLLDFETTGALMMQLVDAWRCGDHAALSEVLFSANAALEDLEPQERARFDAVTASIFDQRNATMASGIERFIHNGEGSYFIVVGAGHLIGDNSVVELLRESGYTVTPVRKAP
jgi:uncharacterized protein YbaP (TraB family)